MNIPLLTKPQFKATRTRGTAIEDSFTIEDIKLVEKAINNSVPQYTSANIEIYDDEILIPHKQNYELLEKFFKKIPKVFNAINTKVDFVVQTKWYYEGEEEDIKKLYTMESELNIPAKLIPTAKSMCLYGNAYWELVRDEDWKIIGINVLHPATMYVAVSKEDNFKITHYYQKKEGLMKTKQITFEPEDIIHFKWNIISDEIYGMSDILASSLSLMFKLNIERNSAKITDKLADPLIFVPSGTEKVPGNDPTNNVLKSQINNRKIGSVIVTNVPVQATIVSPLSQGIAIQDIQTHFEKDVDTGLRTPSILQGTSQSNRAESQVMMDAYEREVRTLEMVIATVLEDRLFAELLNKDEIPRMIWADPTPTDELKQAQQLQILTQSGIPTELAMKIVGLGAYLGELKELGGPTPIVTNPTNPKPMGMTPAPKADNQSTLNQPKGEKK